MSVGRIASRYAKSLLDLSVERGSLETIIKDMDTFNSVMKSKAFRLLMKSPIVDQGKKKSIIDAIFKGKVDDLTLLFFKTVIDKGREPYLDLIMKAFVLQYREKKGISTVNLITATALKAEVIDAITAKLSASIQTDKEISLTTEVNPGLMGGFIVEFDDRRYDASIANKILDLKKEFDTNLYEKRF